MPSYRITIDGQNYRVNSAQEMTDQQAYEAAAGQHADLQQKHNAAVSADQQGVRERFAEEEKARPLTERIATNVGAGMHKLWQGVSFAGKDDVADHNRLRAGAAETMPGGEYVQMGAETLPLMLLPAGGAGRVLSKAVPALRGTGAKLIGGRAANVADIMGTQGATAALTTAGDATDRAISGATALGFGGALPGAVAAVQGGRRMLTGAGRSTRAAERFVDEFGGQKADEIISAATAHGPNRFTQAGVHQPTVAQLTGDPAMRELETGLRAKVAPAFAAGDELAAQGRAGRINEIAGTDQGMAAAETARNAATGPMREGALAQAEKAKGFEWPLVHKVEEIAVGDARSNPQVKTMLNYVRGELEQGVTPGQLYTIRKTLTHGTPHGTELGAAISQSRHERVALVKAIDTALDLSTGGQWTPYMKTYAEMSGPVTSMKAGQQIKKAFANSAQRTETGEPIYTASKLRGAVAKYGEKQFGSKTLPRVTEGERSTLNAVADSIEASDKARKSQGLIGSATTGNIHAADAAEHMAGLAVETALPGIGGKALKQTMLGRLKNRREMAMAELMQDPERFAQFLQEARTAAPTRAEVAARQAARGLGQGAPRFLEE